MKMNYNRLQREGWTLWFIFLQTVCTLLVTVVPLKYTKTTPFFYKQSKI